MSKSNTVRYFDEETFLVTIARREIAAAESLVRTAEQEILAAPPSAQGKASEPFCRLYQHGESVQRQARQSLEAIRACQVLRGDEVAA